MSSSVGALHKPADAECYPASWTWSRLDAVCEGVIDCPHSTPQLTPSGPLVARSQDIRSGVLDVEAAAHVSEATYVERIARAEPRRGDLLYSREGTYFGIAAEVPEDTRVCLGQRMVLVRPRHSQVHFRYLKYWLNSPVITSHIHGFRDGSVAERLNLPTIRGLPVVLPPLPEQKRIAGILGALDDKIDLNRRMSHTLESIARAIFKSWFVDFDPVHKKMEGKEGGELAPPPSLVAPLSDSMELSGRKELWRWGALSDVADLNPESWTKSSRPSLLLYIDLSSVKSGRIDGVVKCSNADAPSRAQRILRHGDTVVGTVRPGNRSFALIQRDGLTGSTGFAVLRPRRPEFREIVYLAVTTDESIDHLAQLADGGAYPAVRPEAIASTAIRVPPVDVAVEVHSLVRPLFEQIACNEEQDRLLAGVRERLLPRLLSGALVRVPA